MVMTWMNLRLRMSSTDPVRTARDAKALGSPWGRRVRGDT
jgi:hypothetical protein